MSAGRSASDAIAAIPRRPQQVDSSESTMARPPCWVARITERWHYYGKNCCHGWQPPEIANLTGIIAEYNWRAMHSNMNALVPIARPRRTNDNDGCWVESESVVNFSAGTSPAFDDVFDPAGFAALNMAEFTYTSEGETGGLDPTQGMRRIDLDNAGFADNSGRGHAYVIMSAAVFDPRKIPACPGEPRLPRFVAFFHRYFLPLMDHCI